MSDFNPGLGWREVGREALDTLTEWVSWNAGGATKRIWVREVPVPPLPTAPYTVIHVTWLHASPRDYSAGVLMRRSEGDWEYEPGVVYEGDDLHGDITDFEVLSEPRAVTAKAVLDRVLDTTGLGSDYDVIAREFGVQS